MNCGDEAGASSGHLDWRFSQVSGERSAGEEVQEGEEMLDHELQCVDYMTLKLWDINLDSGPVSTFQVHEHLKTKGQFPLCDLYENDSVFDKFECCLNGDGLRVATGSYRRQVKIPARPSIPSLSSTTRVVRRGAETPGSNKNGNTFDHATKLLHPTEN
ncbi:hypothetical protein YC2023_039291 [Brassica napus]